MRLAWTFGGKLALGGALLSWLLLSLAACPPQRSRSSPPRSTSSAKQSGPRWKKVEKPKAARARKHATHEHSHGAHPHGGGGHHHHPHPHPHLAGPDGHHHAF